MRISLFSLPVLPNSMSSSARRYRNTSPPFDHFLWNFFSKFFSRNLLYYFDLVITTDPFISPFRFLTPRLWLAFLCHCLSSSILTYQIFRGRSGLYYDRFQVPERATFLGGTGVCYPGKFWNLVSLRCHFLHFGGNLWTICFLAKSNNGIHGASADPTLLFKPHRTSN